MTSSFRKRNGITTVLTMAFLVFVCGHCAKNGATTAPSAISALPTATGPVAGSSAIGFPHDIRSGLSLQSATTGTLIKNWSTTTWDSTKSAAMCNTGNMTANLLSEAGNADRMMCYTGAMQDGGMFSSSLLDGTIHYVQLTTSGGHAGPNLKVKIQATKSGAAIQTFKMWTCESTTTTNDSYDGVDLTNLGAVQLVSVSNHTGSQGTGAQRTVVTGSINGSGEWLTKVITHNGAFSGGTGPQAYSMGQQFSLTQYATYAELNGFFTGTFGGNSQVGRIFSDFAILGASSLSTFAMGNGIVKSLFNNTGGHIDSSAQLRAWLGDTQLPATADATADYYSTVNAGTLATVTTPNTAYLAAEQWDCQATGTTFTAIDMSTPAGLAVMAGGLAACDTKLRFNGGNWTDCNSGHF